MAKSLPGHHLYSITWVTLILKPKDRGPGIDGESMTNHWETIEKSMICGDLQNLDLCDTSAVKTWICRYSDGQQSMKNHENPMENPCSRKLCKNHVKFMKNMSKMLPKSSQSRTIVSKATQWDAKVVQRLPGGSQEASKAPKVDLETTKRRPRVARLDLLVFYIVFKRPQFTGRMRCSAGRLTELNNIQISTFSAQLRSNLLRSNTH